MYFLEIAVFWKYFAFALWLLLLLAVSMQKLLKQHRVCKTAKPLMWHSVSLKEYCQFSGVCLNVWGHFQYLTESDITLFVFVLRQRFYGCPCWSVCD